MKIREKLSLNITLIILGVFITSMLMNRFFIEKYYLHSKKIYLEKVREELQSKEPGFAEKNLKTLEEEYKVSIAVIEADPDINRLNESLKFQLEKKKLVLSKFWIGEDRVKEIKNRGYSNGIYNQGKLKSSFLVSLTEKNGKLILIGIAIPHINESLTIINSFNIWLMGIGIFFATLIICFVLKKELSPLERLALLTEELSELKFGKIEVKEENEIEILGRSINTMSDKLKEAYENLNEKNNSLKEFIGNITHETKTPLALIKAYAIGIKDGVDDGSFADTIVRQADYMNGLIDKLLEFSRIEKMNLEKEKFFLNELFSETIKEFGLELENRGIEVRVNGLKEYAVCADREKIKIVLSNLISNGIKYGSDNIIYIDFAEKEEGVCFAVRNRTANVISETERLWEPFYVAEKSRDKNRSGTGLGLAVVKMILDKHSFDCRAEYKEDMISFTVFFPLVYS